VNTVTVFSTIKRFTVEKTVLKLRLSKHHPKKFFQGFLVVSLNMAREIRLSKKN